MAQNQEYPVALPSVAYEEMADHWDLILDLLGGTKAMQDAGEKWLPREQAEDITEYGIRLGRSILYEGLGDTLSKLSARPFSRPVTVEGLPEGLDYLLTDVDSTGKNLDSLCQEVLYDMAKFGIAHILVDHTEVETVANGGVATIADEKAQGARVLLRKICPTKLIGWQVEIIRGVVKLKQIRIREEAIEADGDYGDKKINYIRVINADNTWELWKNEEGTDKWELYKSGVHTAGEIRLVTIYAKRAGFMKALPPLEPLAWLNLAHWQSSSDQRNILRRGRFAILFGKGFPKMYVDGEKELVIGPTTAYLTDDESADLKYVEPQGNAIQAGERDLQDLEVKMEMLGQQPLMRTLPDSTATAKRIDESRTVSQLQRWIREEEDGIKTALEYACRWRAIEPPDIEVNIYSDFEAVMYGGSDKEFLLRMRQGDEISSETFLAEVKRRGVLADGVDPKEEAQSAADGTANTLKGLLSGDEDQSISPDDGE